MQKMKSTYLWVLIAIVVCSSCKKTIDLYPVSNLNTGTYYSTLDEVRAGLAGAYKGLQAPLTNEWALTELRSDNSKQGQPGSTSTTNIELNQLDMFQIPTFSSRVLSYWLDSYSNIRNANIIIEKLGVKYDQAAAANTLSPINIPLTEADRKQLAGEALFIRAHHYFNLVRLFGGVFLLHTSVSPEEAKTLDRASVDEVYKLIIADLRTAADVMNTLKYNQVNATDRGRATSWAAKTLLGKVYLTLNRKSEALTLLNDVRMNSGHSLVTAAGSAGNAYANVFSQGNEVNEEIIFTVRFKGGGVGLGSTFPNLFAPLNSGTAVFPGNGQGLNHPTADLDSSIQTTDTRKATNIARWVSGTSVRPYTRKYTTTVAGDSESDWPILRFADVLLMIAEAEGNTGNSISMINLVRQRAGVPQINAAGITSRKLLEDTLANERRVEFAFENHRWFDLLRYNATMQTIKAEDVMKAHFAKEHPVHYALYPAPAPTIEELQARVTRERVLLPIPQREIDTNPRLQSQQNPGY